jgi:DNA-binding transcriptional ArsR family regulator
MTRLVRVGGSVPSWMRRLAEGDRATLERLAGAVRSQFETVVAPVWADVRAAVEADRSRRARLLLEEGCEGLLRSYQPMMRWVPPVLQVDVRHDRSLHLEGRGLLLVPSYLSWRTPDFLRDPSLPPVLVYPVEPDLRVRSELRASGGGLPALIGQTRTSVLASIGAGRTTSELARRIGVSAASISQHTGVLRETGLIRSSRIGKAVLHTITPLGAALLDAADPAHPTA